MFSPRQRPNNMRPFPPQPMKRQPPNFHPYNIQQGNPPQGGVQGLFQRFLKPKTQPGFHGPPGMQGFQSGQSEEKFASLFGNVQQAIKLAQTATPLIQQYGPMVKNIPMMISMIKALNEDETETTQADTIQEEKREAVRIKGETLNRIETNTQKPRHRLSSKKAEGASTPKLFI